MTTRFIGADVWKAITGRARQSKKAGHRSWVAVAYFGKDGPKLLPLSPGSRLVVDASESSVKGGRTCPAALKKLVKRGVKVYSVGNLHAKTFVFGRTAFIGSANVSRHSADYLKEAVVRTTDATAVQAAREFVEALCLDELGPAALDSLQKKYLEPKPLGGKPRRRSGKKPTVSTSLPRLHLAHLSYGDPPEESAAVQEQGRKVAKKRMEHPRRHELSEIYLWGQWFIEEGDTVIQIMDEKDGKPSMVSPPGKVLYTRVKRVGRKKYTFVYIECAKRRRVRQDLLAKHLGQGALKVLKSEGLTRNQDFVARLLKYWQR